MLDLKCFVFSLFLCLSINSSQHSYIVSAQLDHDSVISVNTADNMNHSFIVNLNNKAFYGNIIFKKLELPHSFSKAKTQQLNTHKLDYKLLYLKDSLIVPLKLSIKEIIFPFHFFT